MSTMTLFSVAASVVTEPEKVDVWEIACSAQSGLTAAAERNGLTAKRKSYFNGYDLWKPETYRQLWADALREKPRFFMDLSSL